MKLRDAPIQRKLLSVIMLTCLTVLLLLVTAYIILEYYSFRRATQNNLLILSEVIATNSTAALAFDSQKDANEILSALKANQHITAACLYNKEGKIFATYPLNISLDKFSRPPFPSGSRFLGGDIEVFTDVLQEGNKLGTLYIKSDMEATYVQLKHYALTGILLLVGSLLVTYILSLLLQKTISEPILLLEKTAKAITEKRDYSVRATQFGKDELGSLTNAFNEMLTQIQNQNNEILSFNQNLERKIVERTHALQEQKDFVETIINSSVDMIAVFDRDLNYLMLNSRADDFYNLKNTDIIGKNIFSVFPQISDTSMHHDLMKAMNGEYVHNDKYKSPISNNTFESYYIPLKDKSEHVWGVLTIAHDITKIIETNEQLESLNAELVKSNRDLEQFAYVASHDLQEPMRKIQTFAQLIEANPENKEKQKLYFDKISQAASRMQNLINDVLSYSRVLKKEEAFVETDLNKIIENIKNDFELVIREKDAVINYPKMPVIRGIPLQLYQLFSNIINNSLKYNDNKPVINIAFSKLTNEELISQPKLNPDFYYLKFEITDNGIGFEQEFSEKIFNIFQRLHGVQNFTGTGIGLAICKKIVENHQGVIYARGEPKVGATFTVILPV